MEHTDQYSFVVPGKPGHKQRPRVLRSGHTYTPTKTVNYENWIKQCFIGEYPNATPMSGALVLSVFIHCPIPQSKSLKIKRAMRDGDIMPTTKPDIDNVLKVIGDALNGLAYIDDKQIVRVICDKRYGEQPRLDIQLTDMESC